MKKYCIFLGIALTASFAACNKNATVADVSSGKSALVTLDIHRPPVTRATVTGTADENAINTIDAFVFNATGDLDAYSHFAGYDGSSQPTMECTTGPDKEVYILINAEWPESELEAGIATRTNLEDLVFTLENNCRKAGNVPSSLDNFEMVGKAGATLVPGANAVSVNVSRVVSRVKINKITRQFASKSLNKDLKIKNIYMSNVAGSYGLGSDGEIGLCKNAGTDLWHNKYVYNASHTPKAHVDIELGMNSWLNKGLAADVTLAYEEDANHAPAPVSNTSIAGVFYVMPNNVPFAATTGGDGEWSPRHTKLVIETEYQGKTYYYAIPIVEIMAPDGAAWSAYPILPPDDANYAAQAAAYKGLRANRSFEIEELVLTRLGSTNPDEPVMAADVTLTISVNDWELVTMETEGGKYVI